MFTIAIKYKILVFGAGVIGSIYAVNFSKAGYDVFVYARGKRLEELKNKGLLYCEKGTVKEATVTIVDSIASNERYDYIFVSVRYEQIEPALAVLTENKSPNIVTLVNNPKGYATWQKLIGQTRLIPAFAGAGGSIDHGVLHGSLTPGLIQPTTFGEVNGAVSERVLLLKRLLKTSGIPVSISKNMDAWQKSHIAMVTSLANGLYLDGGDIDSASKNTQALYFSCYSLKERLKALKKMGIPVTPLKIKILGALPVPILLFLLRIVYKTQFADTFINRHALAAKHEMLLLDKDFRSLTRQHGVFLTHILPAQI